MSLDQSKIQIELDRVLRAHQEDPEATALTEGVVLIRDRRTPPEKGPDVVMIVTARGSTTVAIPFSADAALTVAFGIIEKLKDAGHCDLHIEKIENVIPPRVH